MASTFSTGTDTAPLQAARALAPRAAELAEQIERERGLPGELVEAMRDGGLFSMCLPQRLGGGETRPVVMIETLEQLAAGDGSAAWCSMVGSTSSLLGAFVPEADAELAFAGGRGIAAGVFAPRGRARRTDEGFLVSGRWSFVSGVGHCSWVMGGCIVEDRDGNIETIGGAETAPDGAEPARSAAPDVRLMLMPVEHVEVIDTWSVSGLRGTGSHDVLVEEELVPVARGVSLFSDSPRHDGVLYAFPLFGLLALGISAVALGIARGALAELVELAAGKTPQGGARTLAGRATVQASVARAEASLRAARALLLGEAARAEAQAAAEGSMTTEARAGLRLAATHATSVAAEVATEMYRAGGGSAIYESSPLQRRFRDANVATQHMMVAPATWELTGRLLLGVPTDTVQL